MMKLPNVEPYKLIKKTMKINMKLISYAYGCLLEIFQGLIGWFDFSQWERSVFYPVDAVFHDVRWSIMIRSRTTLAANMDDAPDGS